MHFINLYSKFYLSLCGIFLVLSAAFSQQNFVMPEDLPNFKAQMVDGTTIEKSTLHFDKPLMLVYFAPDCEHCQKFTKEMVKNINSFKGTNILMVSFMPIETVKKFQTDYKLEEYKNIQLGTESPVFAFRNYYRLQQTPFIGLYNKKGKLVKSYKISPPIEDLTKEVKKMSSKNGSGK
ncbi:MAG: hypothetical protein C5B52_14120 [Bacteroidetes bacterium]|nr:MAG: hypothetical protein C5B52_14120 [Bacteroidota bacterium]